MYKFKCPCCGCDTLVERTTIYRYQDIVSINDELCYEVGDNMDDHEAYDTHTVFICDKCGEKFESMDEVRAADALVEDDEETQE